jgi:hypothetical protein
MREGRTGQRDAATSLPPSALPQPNPSMRSASPPIAATIRRSTPTSTAIRRSIARTSADGCGSPRSVPRTSGFSRWRRCFAATCSTSGSRRPSSCRPRGTPACPRCGGIHGHRDPPPRRLSAGADLGRGAARAGGDRRVQQARSDAECGASHLRERPVPRLHGAARAADGVGRHRLRLGRPRPQRVHGDRAGCRLGNRRSRAGGEVLCNTVGPRRGLDARPAGQ